MEDKSIENRLASLQEEHRKGRRHLFKLQQQQLETRQTLLRIEGAMQILEELLNPAQSTSPVLDQPIPISVK